jgi:dihydroorotase
MVADGTLSLAELIAKMSIHPARILGVPCGLKPGMPADITLIDPESAFIIDAARFRSRSRNSPFIGMQAPGKAVLTMVGGRVVFEENQAAS